MNENLVLEVVRMLEERENYFHSEFQKYEQKKSYQTAIQCVTLENAYNSAREMLMAAITNNVEILRQFDTYHKEV